jgi:hypothetical protein
MSRSQRQPKEPRQNRGQRSAKALSKSAPPRRIDNRMAPPKYAERRHAKPGAGVKRSRASMSRKSR